MTIRKFLIKLGIWNKKINFENFRNIYYSLPIYISVESQLMSPNSVSQGNLREFFKTLNVKDGPYNEKFIVIDPDNVKLYRVVQAFKFYFNSKINRKNINILSDLIKKSFDKYSLGNLRFNLRKFWKIVIHFILRWSRFQSFN